MITSINEQKTLEKILNIFGSKAYKLVWHRVTKKVVVFKKRIGTTQFNSDVYESVVGSRKKLEKIIKKKNLQY